MPNYSAVQLSRRGFLGAMAGTVVVGALAGCTGGGGSAALSKLPKSRVKVDASTPSWKADTAAKKNLTWFVDETYWNPPMQSKVAEQIAKDLNLTIKYVAGDDTKLNTYFASGNLPDIITLDGATNPAAATASQWALPLNQLATKYDPYWNTVASAQTMDWFKLSDGNTYGYPCYSNSAADYKSGKIKPEEAFIIRKDVYSALGEPKITSPDDFVAMMSQIKAKFPDLTALGFSASGTLDGAIQDLIGVPYYKDGKYYDRDTDPDYLKWVEAIRQVGAAGGFSQDELNATDTVFQQNISSGKFASVIIASAINYASSLQALLQAHPDQQYIAVTAIQSTVGNKPVLQQAGISGFLPNYITHSTKDPQSAMELFTYLQSDYGQILTTYGFEGKTYQKNADGTVQLLPAIKKLAADNNAQYNNEWGIGQFYLFGHDKWKDLDPTDSYPAALTTIFDWGKGRLTPEFPVETATEFSTGSIQGRDYTNITNKWATTLASMVTASSAAKAHSALSAFTSFRNSNGWSQVEAAMNKNVKSSLKRLGMPANASTPNT